MPRDLCVGLAGDHAVQIQGLPFDYRGGRGLDPDRWGDTGHWGPRGWARQPELDGSDHCQDLTTSPGTHSPDPLPSAVLTVGGVTALEEEAAFGARLSLLCSARPQHALVPVFHGLLLFPFFSSPLLSRLWVSFGRGLSTGDGKGIAFACFRCWQLGEVCYAGSLRQQMRTEPGCCLKARTQEFLIEIISLCLLRAIDTCLLKKSV